MGTVYDYWLEEPYQDQYRGDYLISFMEEARERIKDDLLDSKHASGNVAVAVADFWDALTEVENFDCIVRAWIDKDYSSLGEHVLIILEHCLNESHQKHGLKIAEELADAQDSE